MAINPIGVFNNPASAYAADNLGASSRTAKNSGTQECQTCRERKYRCGDGSPESVSASTSSAQVMSHEKRHLVEQKASADRKEMEVVNTSIRIEYNKCPECGRMYASDGEATTTMRTKPDQQAEGLGNFVDLEA